MEAEEKHKMAAATIGELVAIELRRTGFTRMRLAEVLQIDYRTFRRVTSDPWMHPRSKAWEALAKYLGCTERSLRLHVLEDPAYTLTPEPRPQKGSHPLQRIDQRGQR